MKKLHIVLSLAIFGVTFTKRT